MPRPAAPDDAGWTALADRVWRVPGAGTAGAERNTVVIAGARGSVLVDPPGGAQTATLPERLAELSVGDVVAVVLTHAHAAAPPEGLGDRWPHAVLHAHEDAALPEGTPVRRFSSVAVIDLGDRTLELVHPGRAHTAGDLLVRAPEADVIAAGGLVSGDGVPAYGPESFPLGWPAALDLVIGLTTAETVVVPRTGRPLTREDLEQQRSGIGVVAETIADLASRGVPVHEAPGAADWPFPVERLGDAVQRAYDQLPRTSRRLPLL
jgi:glyoxylase-like metal-dependent hydrolase (beta-lactamase superfamily II)